MNEANLFTYWLDQDRPSKLTRSDVQRMSIVDVTSKLDVGDLVAILYHGSGAVALSALSSLREKFEWEMNYLESLTYPQGEEA